jgi:hypothetical protein
MSSPYQSSLLTHPKPPPRVSLSCEDRSVNANHRKKNLLRTHASRKDTIPRIPHLRTTSDVKMNKGILLIT